MSTIRSLTTFLLLVLSLAGALHAQDQQPNPAIGNADRKAVIESLAEQLQSNYVFPDVAKKLATALASKQARGDYASAGTADSFAKALTHDLREIGKDGHFVVGFDPDFHPPAANAAVPSKAELAQQRQQVAGSGFGIQRVERLPGNVAISKYASSVRRKWSARRTPRR